MAEQITREMVWAECDRIGELEVIQNLSPNGTWLLGMMVQHHKVTHASVLITPDYIRLRQVLTTALRKHPDAARDVAHALHALEAEAAAAITESKRPILLEASAC